MIAGLYSALINTPLPLPISTVEHGECMAINHELRGEHTRS